MPLHINKIIFGLLFLSFCSLVSCITPPKLSNINDPELFLVSKVKKGQQLVKSGRFREAEVHLRIAEQKSPRNHFIKNDLGFSLLSQQRWDEAIYFFLKALELKPRDLTASLNLARAYYNSGHLEASAALYHEIILHNEYDKLNSINLEENNLGEALSRKKTKKESPKDFISHLYRRLATVYYALGYFDDALCFSEKAFELALNMEETEQHVRMHLALDRVDKAFEILKATIAVHRNSISSGVLLDYSLALYLKNEHSLSKQAILKYMQKKGISEQSKSQAMFINFLIEKHNQKLPKAQEKKLFQDRLGSRVDICENENLDFFNYWPDELKKLSSLTLKKYC